MSAQREEANEQVITKLAPIAGRWKIGEGSVVYEGPGRQNAPPYGICVSDLRFSEGEARVTVTRTKDVPVQARILLGYRSEEDEYFSAGLGGAWVMPMPSCDGARRLDGSLSLLLD